MQVAQNAPPAIIPTDRKTAHAAPDGAHAAAVAGVCASAIGAPAPFRARHTTGPSCRGFRRERRGRDREAPTDRTETLEHHPDYTVYKLSNSRGVRKRQHPPSQGVSQPSDEGHCPGSSDDEPLPGSQQQWCCSAGFGPSRSSSNGRAASRVRTASRARRRVRCLSSGWPPRTECCRIFESTRFGIFGFLRKRGGGNYVRAVSQNIKKKATLTVPDADWTVGGRLRSV